MRRSSFASTIDSAFGDQFGDEHFYRQRMAEPRVLAERLGFESTRKSRRSPVTQDGFRVGPSLHMTPATGGFLAGRSRRALSSSARMFPLIAGRYLPRSIFAKNSGPTNRGTSLSSKRFIVLPSRAKVCASAATCTTDTSPVYPGMKGERHSTRVHLMMSQSELRTIGEWQRRQPDLPTRAEAIRRLIQLGLTAV